MLSKGICLADEVLSNCFQAFGERPESYGVCAVGIIYAFIYFLGFFGPNGTENRGSGRALGSSALVILTVVALYFNDSAVMK